MIARELQAVERVRGDDQGMGRVQATRDADHDLLDVRRPQAGLEPADLDVVDLLAALGAARGVGRHVREALVRPLQHDRLRWKVEVEGDPSHLAQALAVVVDRVTVAAGARAVGDDPVEVDVAGDQLLVVGEPLGLGEQVAVLVDHRLSVPGKVGGRFSEPGSGEDVGRHRAPRLRGTEQLAVVGLADRDVARGQVRQHRRARHRAVAAWRNWRPDVLADLDVDDEVRLTAIGEQQVGAERYVRVEQADRVADRVASGSELALFVVLAVLGQVALGNHSEQPAAMDYDGGVEQAALGPQRRAHHQDGPQTGAVRDDPLDRVVHPVKQRMLMQEVVDRVGGQPELGEDHQRRAGIVRLSRERDRVLRVVLGLRDPNVRHGRRHAHEVVAVERVKRALIYRMSH